MAINNGVAPKNPVQQKFKAGDIADPKAVERAKSHANLMNTDVQYNFGEVNPLAYIASKTASYKPTSFKTPEQNTDGTLKPKMIDMANVPNIATNGNGNYLLKESTIGGGQPGGNFYYGPGIQQGGVNSQVSTGAMAPIPNQVQGMNVPKISNDTNKMNLPSVESNYPTLTANENTGTTVPKNTKRGTGGAKATNTQQQSPKEPEGFWENGVWYKDATDRNAQTAGSEFGGLIGKKEEAPQQEQPQQDDNAGEQAISQMESDLAPESGMIYGRATGDSSNPSGGIQTNVDEYSASYLANQGRVSNMNALQSMDSQSIAASIISGTTPYGSQAMRDLMQYNPGKYEEIQNAIKQLKGQNVVNGIASGNLDYTTGMNGQSNIANDKTDFALSNSNGVSSVGDILKNVNETLASNQVASTAQEQMGTIENDMINLQNRLKNLQDEARKVFKGDVPAYVIQAYVSNRTAEIQDQLSVLDQRYNAAYNRYQQEWEQTRWNAEMDLKKQELAMKQQSLALDEWSTRQGVELNWAKLNASLTSGGTSTTITGNTVQTTSLSRQEIGSIVDNLVTQCQNGQLGNAQCAAGVQKNYFPYLGVDLGSLSAYSAKQGICNEDTSYIPQKGDIVVMSSSTQPQYGHMGMVVGVEGNTMTYLDWNGTVKNGVGTEEPAIRTIQLTDSKLYGYYNPTKTNGSANGYSYDWEKDYATDFYRMDPDKFSKLSNDARKEAYGLAGGKDEFYKKRKLYNDEVVKKEGQKQGVEVLTSIAELYNMASNKDGKLDFVWGAGRLDGTKDKFDQIKEKLKLEALFSAKNNGASFGSMTEGEWGTLEKAANSLKWGRLDSTINDEMEKVIAAVYHATYGREMTKSDRNNFKNNVKNKNNWNNTIEEEYSVTDILSA